MKMLLNSKKVCKKYQERIIEKLVNKENKKIIAKKNFSVDFFSSLIASEFLWKSFGIKLRRMKILSVFAAAVLHYYVGAMLDNAAVDFPKLCVLIAMSLTLLDELESRKEPSYIPCCLEVLQDFLFAFAVIEITLIIVWGAIEILTAFVVLKISYFDNQETSLKIDQAILSFLAVGFLLYTFSGCLSCKNSLNSTSSTRGNSKLIKKVRSFITREAEDEINFNQKPQRRKKNETFTVCKSRSGHV